ncbi:hypothetical protein D3C71_2151400 [compost metagenome]
MTWLRIVSAISFGRFWMIARPRMNSLIRSCATQEPSMCDRRYSLGEMSKSERM